MLTAAPPPSAPRVCVARVASLDDPAVEAWLEVLRAALRPRLGSLTPEVCAPDTASAFQVLVTAQDAQHVEMRAQSGAISSRRSLPWSRDAAALGTARAAALWVAEAWRAELEPWLAVASPAPPAPEPVAAPVVEVVRATPVAVAPTAAGSVDTLLMCGGLAGAQPTSGRGRCTVEASAVWYGVDVRWQLGWLSPLRERRFGGAFVDRGWESGVGVGVRGAAGSLLGMAWLRHHAFRAHLASEVRAHTSAAWDGAVGVQASTGLWRGAGWEAGVSALVRRSLGSLRVVVGGTPLGATSLIEAGVQGYLSVTWLP